MLLAARSHLAAADAAGSVPNAPTRTTDAHSSMLDEIRRSKPLRSAASRAPAAVLPSLSAMTEPSRNSLAATLAAAIAQRRRDLNQRAHNDDDDEWSD